MFKISGMWRRLKQDIHWFISQINFSAVFHRKVAFCFLRVHHRAQALGVFNKWHVAFHGTRVDSINPILECGDLLIPGMLIICVLCSYIGGFTRAKHVFGSTLLSCVIAVLAARLAKNLRKCPPKCRHERKRRLQEKRKSEEAGDIRGRGLIHCLFKDGAY